MIQLDPAGAEPQAILAAADLSGARVLEIGAGDGRLTFRYADRARYVVAVDNGATGFRPTANAAFASASAVALPFRNMTFDIVLLASSL